MSCSFDISIPLKNNTRKKLQKLGVKFQVLNFCDYIRQLLKFWDYTRTL